MNVPSRRWLTFGLASITVLALPAHAFAVGGNGGDDSMLTEVVALLLVVTIAYILSWGRERLGKRFRIMSVSGVQYLVLGVLLGPMVPQIHAFDDLTGLLPIIALAAGWFGLLRGVELNVSHFKDAPAGSFRLALADDIFAGAFVFVPALLLFQSGLLGPVDWKQAWMGAAVLGCCAAVGSTEPIDVIKQHYHVEGRTVPLLRRAARMGDAIALFVFGTLFCVIRQDTDATPLSEMIGRFPSAIEWFFLTLALGGGLGVLFRFFLAGNESENARFLTLVGIISFAAGAAWFLQLSTLMLNLLLGAVLVNTAKVGTQVQATLERTQRPMTLVLLVFAGALWTPPPEVLDAFGAFWDSSVPTAWAIASALSATTVWVIAPPIAVALLRVVGKAIASRLVASGESFRPDLFRGLLGMGDVAIAMAISFRLVYDGAAADVAYTTILGSVILHDLIAPRLLRSLLVDAGELRREQKA